MKSKKKEPSISSLPTLQYGVGGGENGHVHRHVVGVGQPDHAVGAVVRDAAVVVQRDHAAMSAAGGQVEGRAEGRHGRPVAGRIGVELAAGRRGPGDQLGVHEVVHVLAVLAVLPGHGLLDGPRGGQAGDAAVPVGVGGGGKKKKSYITKYI